MILNIAQNAKETSKKLLSIDNQLRDKAILEISKMLRENVNNIIAANKLDIENGIKNKLSPSMLDRLKLDHSRIESMALACEQIANFDTVVGKIISEETRNDGLIIQKQKIPLGVILMIFESRPNVVVDCSALAIKSGNAILLKGGKEAKFSNEILGNLIQEAIKDYLPKSCVQVLDSDNKENINELLMLREYIDVVIPRGGEGLIKYIYENSKIPVIAHFKGVCHIFVDKEADLSKTIPILLNAKTQRPGVCNAMETLLLHKDLPHEFINKIIANFKEKNTELRVDEELLKISNDKNLKIANDSDFACEYLDNILAVKLVSSLDHAIKHIHKFGSNHTEAIITENIKVANTFINSVDASCVMCNASTRFNDGGELGLGAELGIATTKIHAYGPMGANEMTTTRFIVKGNGHIRQ